MFRRNFHTRSSVEAATSAANGGGDDSNNVHYEMVEEEVVETLSDNDGSSEDLRALAASSRCGDDDYYYEEEYFEEEVIEEDRLPGISEEEDEQEEEVVNEVDEQSDYISEDDMNNSIYSLYSMTEVAVVDGEQEVAILEVIPGGDIALQMQAQALDESIYDEETDFEEFVDDTIREDDSGNEEVASSLGLVEQAFSRSCQINELSAAAGTPESGKESKDYETSPEDISDDDDDTVSAEELTEAIEYILRQEKAVSKFILTDEQAEKMAHLPVKVMKVIVDHLEVCDNNGSPIDWDFLLKIVLPFCDSEKKYAREEDDARQL